MAKRYVRKKTSRLYEQSTGGSYLMVLIFGDEVETTGVPVNNRTPVMFRGRPGFLTTTSLSEKSALEIYFIDVGQGDATFIVTPNRKTILVDGGENERARGFLAWKYRLDHPGNSIDIDLLVVSHADADHLVGLIPVIEHPQINVKRILHSGIATFQSGAFNTALGEQVVLGGQEFLLTRHNSLDELDPDQLSDDFFNWKTAIENEATPPVYEAIDSSTGTIDLGDPEIELDVLGPRLIDTPGGGRALPWLGNKSHTINGHSVVLRLIYDEIGLLLPGDMNIEGARHLLADTAIRSKLSCQIFKAPHHGSHEYYPEFIQAVNPQVSVISSGDEPDHGHPRASFIGGVGKYSRSDEPLVFSTEIAATFVEAREIRDTGDDGTGGPDSRARRLFKRRLNGMINVRSDGEDMFAARRVTAGYWWESYGPVHPVPPSGSP